MTVRRLSADTRCRHMYHCPRAESRWLLGGSSAEHVHTSSLILVKLYLRGLMALTLQQATPVAGKPFLFCQCWDATGTAARFVKQHRQYSADFAGNGVSVESGRRRCGSRLTHSRPLHPHKRRARSGDEALVHVLDARVCAVRVRGVVSAASPGPWKNEM